MRDPNSGGGSDGQTGGQSLFVELYVQEVLTDPTLYKFPDPTDPDTIPEGYLLEEDNITEADVLEAPYNSIIARIVSGDDEKSEIIAYPMFQEHVSLPVKAGEHVWAMLNNSRYYWICRKNFNQQVNDVNLAWGGRFKYDATSKRTSESADSASSSENVNKIPSNQNPKINTKFPAAAQQPGEKDMFTFWSERTKAILESVPRYKKRPGDLVLQGSNNTLICLGLGGGHKKEDNLSTSTESLSALIPEQSNVNSGAIDIVTGRGRYRPIKSTDADTLGDISERTAAMTIKSEFGYIETDKNLSINDIAGDKLAVEGDPDFGFDASRIYMSSNTTIDGEFSLIPNYPKIPEFERAEESSTGSSIALKSDNIRLIARYHLSDDYFDTAITDAKDVNGDIRLIKEGTRDNNGHSNTDGTGASLIAMEMDGTIIIDGSKIIIGTGREIDNGTGDHIYLGSGATEPIVLGNQLKTLLVDFFTELQSWLSTKFDTHIHPTGVGPSGPPTVIGNDAGTGQAKSEINKILSKIGMTK